MATAAAKVTARPRVCNFRHPNRGPPIIPPTTPATVPQIPYIKMLLMVPAHFHDFTYDHIW